MNKNNWLYNWFRTTELKSSIQVLDKYMDLIIPVNVTNTNSSNFNAYCTYVITFTDP